jgi:DNA replication protein DnaC
VGNSLFELSTLSSARHFHSDPLLSPPRGIEGGAAPATAEVLVAGTIARGEAFFSGGEVVKGNTDNSGPHTRSLSEAEREALFKRLHLAHMRRIYQEVAVQAEKEGWSYADFLTLLLAEEVAGRKQTRLQRLTRSAHFPFLKTMDEFDFSLQSTLRLALLGSYLGPELVSEGRSLILHGKTGRGKTHLAVAIGYRALQNGFETLFTTAAELIEDLSNAGKKGRLQESLATYTHPHVLVIDEVGYLTYAQDAANVLFHVVNDRHLRKRPMIFTTNKPLNEWGKVLHDEDLAAAILDRVLERGRFIRLDGPSGRTRHLKLEEPLPGATERFRISGNNGSEFPEPTVVKANISGSTIRASINVVRVALTANQRLASGKESRTRDSRHL